MPDLDDRLLVHVFGEADFATFNLDPEDVRARRKVFGTKEGDDYVQVIGALFSGDNWDQLKLRQAENGMTYEDLVANCLISLVAGTESVSFALEGGYNLVALGVFRGVSERKEVPSYSARFLGVSSTTTDDAHAHLSLVREGVGQMVGEIEGDIDAGRIHSDSVIAHMIHPDVGPEDASDDAEEVTPLPQSVMFHEMLGDKGAETVILCACDPEFARPLAQVDDLVVGLISGIVPTPHGSVGYWLWQIAPNTGHGFLQEQFVDLADFPNPTYDRLKTAETVQFVVVDRTTHRRSHSLLLRRASLGIDEFEAMALEVADSEPDADFEAACAHVMETVDPQEFLRQTLAQKSKRKTNLH
ncbi:MAG: hypothetical protein CML50_05175 [Rhodobacteraceae bacterium]|jgi:hypothetical protein|uniref:Uncharacterized protein n=1 Tax=Salipiger profundus TaxID=1229727 RepID=A0A1U7DAV5_9RHOB|nr:MULTISPECIES: hypothetical protein [Salipiger]APX25307.1 hypothetical protein Ga0080559_TMP4511 [Salipiger profundus]MAB05393.1 hypothetical protein [Paracoccaceae bacterium]GGA30352.1 hypothetical protein GCM10011326_47830 [Salipiger profundus]SFD95846.1 hypothetical protein SAMN05444415_1334 [Salipiger profundus]